MGVPAVFSITMRTSRCDEHDLEIIPEDDTRPVPDGIGEINEAVQQQLQAKPLAQQPWFKSGFTRMQAEELLQDGYQGMFIVRESSQPGLFSVSVQAGNETFDHPSKITNMLCLPVSSWKAPDTTNTNTDSSKAFTKQSSRHNHTPNALWSLPHSSAHALWDYLLVLCASKRSKLGGV